MAKVKNNLPAKAYATRAFEAYDDLAKRVNRSKLETVDMTVGTISKAAGEIGTKTTGIKIRGTGAATKGTMARGPMG